LCAIGELIESKMSHEVSLLGHRMEWLVVSEAFLFAAFTLVLTDGRHLGLQLRIFLFCFYTLLGVFLAVSATRSINAALAVSEALCEARGKIEGLLKVRTGLKKLPNLSLERPERKIARTVSDGNFSARWVPPAIGVAWALLLFMVLLLSFVPTNPAKSNLAVQGSSVPSGNIVSTPIEPRCFEPPRLACGSSICAYVIGTGQASDTESLCKQKLPLPRERKNPCAAQAPK
jgi:hypothetical protein